ncbi:hypothetical protein Aasi_1759 [Candidatus Amoebophilus asiaticus 5a2]|uniref:Uncharacterized protein n=1 Tax=Amoebophilus asiaticus (strain 5a2) TaxID=452471 RepID=C3L3Z2_AMOA5|nr:hypothetical protein Aasi_1759 [Candidatus Amoebophilus asiaticus 5a2]
MSSVSRLIAHMVYSNRGGEIFLEGPVALLQIQIFLDRVKKIYKQNTLTISTLYLMYALSLLKTCV